MLSVVSRLETAADGTGTVTFVGSAAGDAGAADRVEWARLHDDARGHRRRAAGAGRRPRRARRDPRPDHPGARHHDPGHLPRRWDRGRAAAADAPRLDRGVRRADPDRASPTPTPRSWWSTPTSRRSSIRRPADAPDRAARRARARGRARRRRRVDAARRRPRAAGDPAVHERLDRRAEGRDAPRPLRRRQHRRHRRRRADHATPTARCRGSRCTTTWGSSGC